MKRGIIVFCVSFAAAAAVILLVLLLMNNPPASTSIRSGDAQSQRISRVQHRNGTTEAKPHTGHPALNDSSKLIWDFTNVAITRHLWFDGSQEPWQVVRHFNDYFHRRGRDLADARDTFGEFAEYIYRPEGLPEAFSLHKWTGEITIGIDWQRSKTFSPYGEEIEKIGRHINQTGTHFPELYPVTRSTCKHFCLSCAS